MGAGGGVAARRKVDEKRGMEEVEPLVEKGLISADVEAEESDTGSWGTACF